ncbi:SIS domain-containing protein (plasmid) [Deinococcus taeanensis]|uniref:SIS domain-containing protein n=1 Tax=Deinococcus taeanensis TaxID=2737050 RepID=UPI001CDC5991|nr:SIS domain-containing protein [Deinococcus taeanensis]UBV44921.1 SIS domain-containing protein [Deinococcus taeanensis]
MSAGESMMVQEAREAPEVVERQGALNGAVIGEVTRAIEARRPAFAMTIARGSSDHACTVLKYALETQLGLPVGSVAPSVHTLYGARLNLRGALMIAVSQSGASPDVVENVRVARAAGALTVALVNVEDSDLAREAEFVVPLQCGEERAVAATKSYLGSLTALLPVIASLSGDRALRRALEGLPEMLRATLDAQAAAQDLAERYRFVERLVVLGRGLHMGVAQEAALKLKETCGVHAEAYSAAEFSHGPKRLLAEGVPVLGFVPADAAADSVGEAYAALVAGSADVRTLGPGAGSAVPTATTGHAVTDPVGSALGFYLFAGALAAVRGLNPDAPPLLSKVTRTR